MNDTSAPFVAVVDDDEDFRRLACVSLQAAGLRVRGFGDAEQLLSGLAAQVPDAICMDLDMPGMGGRAALAVVREQFPELPVIVVSSHSQAGVIVEMIRAGAHDYMTKPFEVATFVQRVAHAASARAQTLRIRELEREAGLATHQGLVGHSAVMKALYRQIDRVASSDVTVLLMGESGTGKEVVAGAIHAASHRKHGPFVAVNCAAVAEGLQDSEFFGHERGAFTGAHERRAGLFERAHGGTLFLDEVAELSLPLQAKLLRVLQERKLRRVGGDKDISVSLRIVAATHKNLEKLVEAGQFRQDLYFRLAVFDVQIPPLRERRGDIALLARTFAQQLAEQEGRPAPELAPDFVAALERHNWPGNIRELKNAVHRALIVSTSAVLRAEHLSDRLRAPIAAAAEPSAAAPLTSAPARSAAPASLAPASTPPLGERSELESAIVRSGGNMAKAARLLGIGRSTLYRKLHAFGIDPAQFSG